MNEPINTDINPHPEWPIEENCCCFHYPTDAATKAASEADALELRYGASFSRKLNS